MTRSKQAWFAVALSAALASCRCATKPTRSAEEFVPRDTTMVVSVPNVGALADKAQAFLASARGGPGGAELVAMSANLARQLGFDPLTRAGLEAAGIEPEASAALGEVPLARGVVAALPVRELDKVEANLQRLAKDRAGAGVVERREHDGVTVTVLSKAAGAAPVVAYAAKDGFVLFGSGVEAVRAVAAATRRADAESIATEPGYVAGRERVGLREAYVFAPNRGPSPSPLLPERAFVGVSLGAKELALRAFVALPEASRALAGQLLAGGGEVLLQTLPAGAPLYVRGGVDLAGLAAALEKEEQAGRALERIREAVGAAGLDLDADVVGNLAPGFALALGISPTATVADAVAGAGPVDPLASLTMLALGEVRDAGRAARTLEKIGHVMEEAGAEVRMREVAGLNVFTASVQGRERVSWALRENRLVVAAGHGERLAQVLDGVAGNKGALDKAGFAPRAQEALFRAEGNALALDFARVNEAIGKLPDSAFGSGPAGFMARSAATGLLRQLAKVRIVAAGTRTDGGVLLDLSSSLE